DRENAIPNLERVEPERSCSSSAVARIDIDLLFAVPRVLALEVRAVAAPVARFRPGGATRVMRHPFSTRQRMLVEVVLEGSVQGQEGGGDRIQFFETTAFDGCGIRRDLQRKLGRRGLGIPPPPPPPQRRSTHDPGQNPRPHVRYPRSASC